MPKLPEENVALRRRVDDLIKANEALGEYLATEAPDVCDYLIDTGLGSFAFMCRARHGKQKALSKLARLTGATKHIE